MIWSSEEVKKFSAKGDFNNYTEFSMKNHMEFQWGQAWSSISGTSISTITLNLVCKNDIEFRRG